MPPWFSGSSPLARGTPANDVISVCLHRFIPAGAGNTSKRENWPLNTAVHPRWRGEHSLSRAELLTEIGSSPLARGTRLEPGRMCWLLRFIPAGAGNTLGLFSSLSGGAVHPRWRGEHGYGIYRKQFDAGSSPLARGTPRRQLQQFTISRFIPAGAGNTSASGSGHPESAVHPRWRGEHARVITGRPTPRGSSPLARGTLLGKRESVQRRRFIPAGAGNTVKLFWPSLRMPVHPRWRGEHWPQRGQRPAGNGSSPLARGTPARVRAALPVPRFIPAGAGNTWLPKSAWRRVPVHPRWRGEHT